VTVDVSQRELLEGPNVPGTASQPVGMSIRSSVLKGGGSWLRDSVVG